jgi:hypothetical protein
MKWMGLLSLVAVFSLGFPASYAQDEKKDPAKQDEKKTDEKKPDAGVVTPPFSLPISADLKTKVGFDDDQVKKVDALYADYKDKVADAQKKLDAGEKKAKKEMAGLRTDIVSKLHDICKDDDQKKKLDEALPAAKKKKDKA